MPCGALGTDRLRPQHIERKREAVTAPQTRGLRAALALILVLLAGSLVACNSGSDSKAELKSATKDTSLAKNAAAAALETINAKHPGVKVLYGQMLSPTNATSTPMWQFLIGSPDDNSVYSAMVGNGKTRWQSYGSVKMAKAEWSKVPTTTVWKIDSDVALKKALELYPNGKKGTYFASFMTYLPNAAVDRSTKPMHWMFSFDPTVSKGSAPTSTVLVDMVTGKAFFPEAPKKTDAPKKK
jgi:hypothetical protein